MTRNTSDGGRRFARGAGTSSAVLAAKARALNLPKPVEVREDGDGGPTAVRLRGWLSIARVDDSWRIDDEWWRERPISRLYQRVQLEDGISMVMFKDLVSSEWREQRL